MSDCEVSENDLVGNGAAAMDHAMVDVKVEDDVDIKVEDDVDIKVEDDVDIKVEDDVDIKVEHEVGIKLEHDAEMSKDINYNGDQLSDFEGSSLEDNDTKSNDTDYNNNKSYYAESNVTEITKAGKNECIICRKDAVKFCAVCKACRYCSNECQKEDWSSHKLLCRSFAAFSDEFRPSPAHVRAILFPVCSEEPQLVWLETTNDREDAYEGANQLVLDPGNGPIGDYGSLNSRLIDHNPRTEAFWGDHYFRVWHRTIFLMHGMMSNNAVWAAAARYLEKVKAPANWRGTIVVTKHRKVEGSECENMAECYDEDAKLCDVDLADYRAIIDYYVWYGPNRMDLSNYFDHLQRLGAEQRRTGVKTNPT